ncbi:MAG: LysR family transcriptional regulator [Acidimicrobiales bacterium]
MTLEDLRVFAVVCELQSLTGAARRLGRTQSAVSQHVRRLEGEVGIALVERGTRGATPTAAGRVLWQSAIDGLAAIDTARHHIAQMRRGEAGRVRVATGGTTVRHVMAGSVVGFRERHPRVALDFRSATSTRRCLEAVRTDQADLAFVTTGPAIRGIEQRPVVESPWALLVRDEDPRAALAQIDVADLAAIRYISLPAHSTSQGQLEHQLEKREVHLSSSTSVEDWDTAAVLVELGLGHAVVPALHGAELVAGRPLRAIAIPWLPPVAFGWAARQWRSLGPLAHELADLVATDLVRRGTVAPTGETREAGEAGTAVQPGTGADPSLAAP